MCSPISHLYPSSSLQVIDGKLAPYLSKVIKFASSHVFSCSLCREKGFICELCHNGQVIYPFQESAIKRYSSSHISPYLFIMLLIESIFNKHWVFMDVDLNRQNMSRQLTESLCGQTRLTGEWWFLLYLLKRSWPLWTGFLSHWYYSKQ